MLEAKKNNAIPTSKDKWYHIVNTMLHHWTIEELDSRTFIADYWNAIMPKAEENEIKTLQIHRRKAKWILENNLKSFWLVSYPTFKKTFKAVHFDAWKGKSLQCHNGIF